MDSVDGFDFVKNLANFVRTHEKALANALQLQRQRKHPQNGQTTAAASSSSTSTTSFTLAEALSRPYLTFTSYTIKSTRLPLTPHHVYYLLNQFEDLGVEVGPINVRLENLLSNAEPVYTSFLNAPTSKGKSTDTESLRSVSSVRSAMSSMTSMWTSFTLSSTEARAERRAAQHREDVRYLYSSFTKLPALRLSPDHRAKLVSGFEQFPFDTAVPLFVFKNLSALEVCDLDFRKIYGWDRLAEQLTQLTVKRAGVEDPLDLLLNIVLDDMDGRRRRSAQIPAPITPSTPGMPWPNSSPKFRQAELARSVSAPTSPLVEQRRHSMANHQSVGLVRGPSSDGSNSNANTPKTNQKSSSPPRPPATRHVSAMKHRRANTQQLIRRSSGSSGSSLHEATPRQSSTDLTLYNILPSSKWRFLRYLSLSENALTYLTPASLAPIADTIQSLDLSGNLFVEVPDALATLTNLRHLNLSNNMIETLSHLVRSPLPAVTTLSLRSNRLQSLVGIERLFSLERLDLRENRLHDPTELARLTGIPEIREVHVVKNPFTRSHVNYRVVIMNQFRLTPGRLDDIVLDAVPATSNEKKQLVDFVPEQAYVPVVKPPLEDESPPPGPAEAKTPPEPAVPVSLRHNDGDRSLYGHQRSSSDFGPQSSTRKKKASRRRIVELSQTEISPPAAPAVKSPRSSMHQVSPRPSTDSAGGRETIPTPYHTAPTTQIKDTTKASHLHRPTINSYSSSPTPVRKGRVSLTSTTDEEDDDDYGDGPPRSPQAVAGAGAGGRGESDLYRQKIEALRSDLGPNWLAALNDDRFREAASPRSRNRSFSPAARTPNEQHQQQVHRSPAAAPPARGVSVGGRTLG